MTSLTNDQLTHFTQQLDARKGVLLGEIRQVLARSNREQQADLLAATGDPGDASATALLREVTEAEVVRDVVEVRDIVAAQQRIDTGRYGVCTDCAEDIDVRRLEVYPTAKRCLACQELHEKTRTPGTFTGR